MAYGVPAEQGDIVSRTKFHLVRRRETAHRTGWCTGGGLDRHSHGLVRVLRTLRSGERHSKRCHRTLQAVQTVEKEMGTRESPQVIHFFLNHLQTVFMRVLKTS